MATFNASTVERKVLAKVSNVIESNTNETYIALVGNDSKDYFNLRRSFPRFEYDDTLQAIFLLVSFYSDMQGYIESLIAEFKEEFEEDNLCFGLSSYEITNYFRSELQAIENDATPNTALENSNATTSAKACQTHITQVFNFFNLNANAIKVCDCLSLLARFENYNKTNITFGNVQDVKDILIARILQGSQAYSAKDIHLKLIKFIIDEVLNIEKVIEFSVSDAIKALNTVLYAMERKMLDIDSIKLIDVKAYLQAEIEPKEVTYKAKNVTINLHIPTYKLSDDTVVVTENNEYKGVQIVKSEHQGTTVYTVPSLGYGVYLGGKTLNLLNSMNSIDACKDVIDTSLVFADAYGWKVGDVVRRDVVFHDGKIYKNVDIKVTKIEYSTSGVMVTCNILESNEIELTDDMVDSCEISVNTLDDFIALFGDGNGKTLDYDDGIIEMRNDTKQKVTIKYYTISLAERNEIEVFLASNKLSTIGYETGVAI